MVILIFKQLKALTKVREIKNVCSISSILSGGIQLNFNYSDQFNLLIKEFFSKKLDDLASPIDQIDAIASQT